VCAQVCACVRRHVGACVCVRARRRRESVCARARLRVCTCMSVRSCACVRTRRHTPDLLRKATDLESSSFAVRASCNCAIYVLFMCYYVYVAV